MRGIIEQFDGTPVENKSLKPILLKNPTMQRKPFIWDSAILALAYTIFGISMSAVIVEIFNPNKFALACFSSFDNINQYAYINNYCRKDVPVEDYFTLALVLHAAVLFIPHYLWKSYFSAHIDCFFRHVSSIDTLREGDTGKYPNKNSNILNDLQKEFGDREMILNSYIAKLVLQFFMILISFISNWIIFGGIDSNITFECYDDNEKSQSFGNVTCAYPRNQLINILQVADYCLLLVAMMMLTVGLLWIFLYNHSLEYYKLAEFCYDSGINPKYWCHKPLKKRLKWCQLKNDFMFLLSSLLATDVGVRNILKAILVEDIIFEKFSTQLTPYENIRENVKGTVIL